MLTDLSIPLNEKRCFTTPKKNPRGAKMEKMERALGHHTPILENDTNFFD